MLPLPDVESAENVSPFQICTNGLLVNRAADRSGTGHTRLQAGWNWFSRDCDLLVQAAGGLSQLWSGSVSVE